MLHSYSQDPCALVTSTSLFPVSRLLKGARDHRVSDDGNDGLCPRRRDDKVV